MQFSGALAGRRVPSRQNDHQRQTPAADRVNDPAVAQPDPLLRERQLSVAVTGSYIHACEIEHHVGARILEHRRQVLLQ
jgi:hypothetical protein